MTRAQNTTELLSCLQPVSTEPLQAQGENFLKNLENITKKTLESCWELSIKESFHICQAHRPLKGLTDMNYSIPARHCNWASDYLSYWPGKVSNTSSQDTETGLEMHQPSSKGQGQQQGSQAEKRQKQQPGHNPAALSESTGEGRKFLREAARQAGQNGQAHIPNSPCALRNTKHVHQP